MWSISAFLFTNTHYLKEDVLYCPEFCFPSFRSPLCCMATAFMHRFNFPTFSLPLHYLIYIHIFSWSPEKKIQRKRKVFFLGPSDLFLYVAPRVIFPNTESSPLWFKAWTALPRPRLYYSIR